MRLTPLLEVRHVDAFLGPVLGHALVYFWVSRVKLDVELLQHPDNTDHYNHYHQQQERHRTITTIIGILIVTVTIVISILIIIISNITIRPSAAMSYPL